MPPYEPKYLKDAKLARDMAVKEYIRMIDVLERKWDVATEAQISACTSIIAKQMQLINDLDDMVTESYNRWQDELAGVRSRINMKIDHDEVDQIISPSELRRYKVGLSDDPICDC